MAGEMLIFLKRITFIYIFLSLQLVFANTGVFFGSGAGITPIQNKEIRLESEKVTFDVTIPSGSAKYGAPFIPAVGVYAEFHLENTMNTAVSLQLGFPFLSLQGFGDEELVINKMNFKVISSGENRSYAIKKGIRNEKLDPQNLFRKIFAWEDKFFPREKKLLRVSYNLDMSIAALPIPYFKTRGMLYVFNYITRTAKTWKGPINKATFHVNLKQAAEEIKRQITNFKETPFRPLVFFFHNIPNAKAAEEAHKGNKNKLLDWLFSFWSHSDDLPSLMSDELSFFFNNEIPIDGINFGFMLLPFPIKITDLQTYIKTLAQNEKRSEKETASSLLALYKEILTKNDWKLASELKPEHIDLVFPEDVKHLKELVEYLERN